MQTTCLKFNRIQNLAMTLLLMFFSRPAYSQTQPPVRGVNGIVHAIAIDPNGNVYVGGSFTVAGTVFAENIAMYNPTSRAWSALQELQGDDGVGGNGDTVNAIAIDAGGRVYVGGFFNGAGVHNARNIAMWDPVAHTWSNLNGGATYNTGPDGAVVNALYLSGSNLYVGGGFISAGGVSATNTAIWNTSSSVWSPMGNLGNSGSKITSITKIGTTIYAAAFNTPNGVVWQWNGASWTALPGISGPVSVISPDFNSKLMAGGYRLLSTGPCGFVELAEWSGTSWSPLNGYPGCGDQVNAIGALGDLQIIGGAFNPNTFDIIVGQTSYPVKNIVEFSPVPFTPGGTDYCRLMGTGNNNGVSLGGGTGVFAITTSSNRFIYVGGDFTVVGGTECANNIAVWDSNANTWSPLGLNQPPVVSITSPSSGSSVSTASTITINATATDDCTVTRVDFFDGTTLLGTSTASPYSVAWSGFSAGTHTLTAVATDNDGAQTTSSPVTVTVMIPPAITTQPQSQTVNAGATATLTVTASGSTPLTYQWYQGSTAVGGNSATLTLANVTDANAGSYKVVVNNAVGSATSSTVTLTVIDPPAITTQPVSQTVNAGGTATFTVTAGGTAPLTYQWYQGTTAVGGNSATLTLANVTDAMAGSYKVVVNNAAGSATSSTVTLTVVDAPTITTQPTSQTVNLGGTATFTVTASGTAPLTYQWYHGTTAVGGSSATLTLANVTDAMAGSYKVVVNNAAGLATSATVTLTVIDPPTITTQPNGQMVNLGGTATFTVAATGTAPLTYQWYHGTTAVGGSSATLTLANVTDAMAGTYKVVINNAAGSVTSSTVKLAVIDPPTITTQPASQTVNAGGTATFTVTASGTAPLTYQWYQGTTAVGGNSATLTLVNVAQVNAGSYTVVIHNAAGSVTSAAATLTVNGDELPSSEALVNVDFGVGTATAKAGFAAVGKSSGDFWNFYTRDDGQGGFRDSGSLAPLKFADATVSGASLTINNAPGAWGNGAADPMYVTYLYPFDGGNVTITLTGLDVGQYAFYLYGHGNDSSQDSSFDLVNNTYSSGSVDYGSLATANSPNYASPIWQTGLQYVVFSNVLVTSTNDVVVITVSPLDSGYAVIAGMQIVKVKNSTPLLNVDFGVGTATAKAGFAATGQSSSDFWNFYSRDDGQGGFRNSGSLAPLQFADTSLSGAGLTIDNAPGAWGNGAADPMYVTYLYPFDGGNVTITLTGLDVGQYAFYLYGHGNDSSQDSSFDLVNNTYSSGSVDYGSLATANSPNYASPIWQAGLQYVVFSNVLVTSTNDVVVITVSPLDSDYAVIAGMQIQKIE